MSHTMTMLSQHSNGAANGFGYSGHNQHYNLASPPPMLPDDSWNDIEIISFGLNDTHLTSSSSSFYRHQGFVHHSNTEIQNPSLIHYAANNGYVELLQKLITTDKSEIDSLDSEGNTPLLLAASIGNLEIIKFLIENGANVNVQNQFDNSALHECAWRGFSQSLEILCQAKAKLHLKNKQGHTALHLAAQKGHNQCCRVLLLSGCKPNIKNNFGDTPLHSASRYGHVGVVRILISAFANVNELNKNDDTSLHIASAMGRKKLAKILLESGCNPTIVNKQGETPMNIALRKSLFDIQELIASPPPLKPIHLKQQELYDRPLQGSYKDIYCAVPAKSNESLYKSHNHHQHEEDDDLTYESRHHHHHGSKGRLRNAIVDQAPNHYKSNRSHRRSRGCKSDYSNSYLASTSAAGLQRSIEKQSSSVSKYYNSMLRKLGGASPLDQDEQLMIDSVDQAEIEDQHERSGSGSPSKLALNNNSTQQRRRNREFPKPKLETLPTEPLEKGEQYFVDLSGHIHKGRIPPGPDMEPLINHASHHQNHNQHHHPTKSRSKS